MVTLEKTKLFKWLRTRDSQLANKALEVRERISRWLTYIPEMFPHYTSHTIDHSDEIVHQVSNVIFSDDSRKPHVALFNHYEAYIVIMGALLHDAGMVVSEVERDKLLASEAWTKFVSQESISIQFNAYKKIIHEAGNDTRRHAAAHRMLRELIAIYFRQRHHDRSAAFVLEHDVALHHVSLGDSRLVEIIANVCSAHGLQARLLRDDERFPLETDIHGYHVNVRFCAILLRLGDLLDLRSNRACPLLESAASPLPRESLPHWEQYSAYRAINITPTQIRIRAQCKTADQHRIIQEWCTWIETECLNAMGILDANSRHGNWRAPTPHIVIRPEASSSYHPVSWKFQLDDTLIFERLIKDAYIQRLVFIRELIQNALDALRCALYFDQKDENISLIPSRVDETIRSRYKLTISFRHLPERSDSPYRTEISVEDEGIGMTEKIVLDNLLQIGRSYYQTDEFRRQFRFVPTSRFGIGFLSVFAESDNIEVETRHASSSESLLLRMTGPRNYILVERGTRVKRGTRVTVRLRDLVDETWFMDQLNDWCRRVEFVIGVRCNDVSGEVRCENPAQFIKNVDDKSTGTTYGVKPIRIRNSDIEGEIYIMTSVDNKGICRWFANGEYAHARLRNPLLETLSLPKTIRCLHGISIGSLEYPELSYRVDYRTAPRIDLARSSLVENTSVTSLLEPHLQQHLSERRWEVEYLQRIARYLPQSSTARHLKFIPVAHKRSILHLSPHDAMLEPAFLFPVQTYVARKKRMFRQPPPDKKYLIEPEESTRGWWTEYLEQRPVVGVYEKATGEMVVALGPYDNRHRSHSWKISLLKLDDERLIGIRLRYTYTLASVVIINNNSTILRWILSKDAPLINEDLEAPLLRRFMQLYLQESRKSRLMDLSEHRKRMVNDLKNFVSQLAEVRPNTNLSHLTSLIDLELSPIAELIPSRSRGRNLWD